MKYKICWRKPPYSNLLFIVFIKYILYNFLSMIFVPHAHYFGSSFIWRMVFRLSPLNPTFTLSSKTMHRVFNMEIYILSWGCKYSNFEFVKSCLAQIGCFKKEQTNKWSFSETKSKQVTDFLCPSCYLFQTHITWQNSPSIMTILLYENLEIVNGSLICVSRLLSWLLISRAWVCCGHSSISFPSQTHLHFCKTVDESTLWWLDSVCLYVWKNSDNIAIH